MRRSNRSVAVFGVFVLAAGLLFAERVSAAPRAPTVIPSPTLDLRDATAKTETAVFAGGCFWGIQAVFQHIKGVTSATSGYAGGSTDKPSYEDVGSGRTGHAESVRVVFDPSVSFVRRPAARSSSRWRTTPLQLNRQGPDVGTQYRSALFYMSDDAEANGRGVHQAAQRRARISQADRHAGRGVQGVLPGRGVPPELRRRESDAAVHRHQRRAEGRESEEAIPGTIHGQARGARIEQEKQNRGIDADVELHIQRR